MNVVNAAIYEVPTGTIVKVLTMPEHMLECNTQAGQAALVCADKPDPRTQYVEADTLKDKVNLAGLDYAGTVLLNDMIVIRGIPVGTQVIWPDQFITTEDDGELECEVTVGGAYTFTLVHPKYFTTEITINVTA